MWMPGAESTITVVNQTGASRSCLSIAKRSGLSCLSISKRSDLSYNVYHAGNAIVKLSDLRDAAAGWLINDTLVLTVDVTVERENRFQLDDAGAPI